MKSSGKAACILPHGVLFRGNAEATIRRQLVRSGYLRGIIGLPANLFYGTGIPACIVVLDKENAAGRKGVFMVDASRGFKKDGPKNRLREQDIHRIVDVFTRQTEVPRYSRLVPLDEIADPKNDFNLNLPRYIDSSEPEDLQDIDGHLRGGIPERDLDALGAYWKVLPGVRGVLFESAGRPGYARLKLPITEVKPAILSHAEFAAFQQKATTGFADWREATTPRLIGFDKDGHPKALIETIAEDLLVAIRKAPLLDAYDIYQHLMDYWAETMQDDVYLIAADGWVRGAQPREIVQVKNKDNKLTWPEPHDYLRGKRRFKSDLVPAHILVARYLVVEAGAIEALDNRLAMLEQQLDEMREENSGEEGLLAEVIEGEGDRQKLTAQAVKARLKEIGNDPLYTDEYSVLQTYADLLEQQTKAKTNRKAAQVDLDSRIDATYQRLTEAEIRTLVVDDKWMRRMSAAMQGELHRVSQTLNGRIRELAERYAHTAAANSIRKWRRSLPRLRTTSGRWARHGSRRRLQADGGGGHPRGLGSSSRLAEKSISLLAIRSLVAATWNSEIRLLRCSNVRARGNDWDDDITQSWPAVSPDIARYELRQGDLVIAMDGSLVGRSYAQLSSDDLPACCFSESRNPIHSLGHHIPDCIRWQLPLRQILGLGQDGDCNPHISPGDIRRLPIPVPPTVLEQRAIATALRDVDALLSGLERLIAKKRDLRQATKQQLLTGQIRLPGFHGEWEIRRLGDVARIKTGSRNNEDKIEDGEYPFFVRSEIVERIDSYSHDCEAILVPGEGRIGTSSTTSTADSMSINASTPLPTSSRACPLSSCGSSWHCASGLGRCRTL